MGKIFDNIDVKKQEQLLTMSLTLAAFPIALVCFPGEFQNLHIFEIRYREMIKDCLAEGMQFVIVPFIDGESFHLGTEMELIKINKTYSDGKLDITVKAIRLMKVHRLIRTMADKKYPAAKVSPLTWNENPNFNKSERIIDLMRSLYEMLQITSLIPNVEDFLVTKVVHKLGLTIEQELSLLRLAEEEERQDFLLEHLSSFIPNVQKMQSLKMKAALNGHFKNIDPAAF